MGGIAGELERLGAPLVVVGSGTPAHARDFQAHFGQGLRLYVDPGLKAFQAFGLKRGVGATLGPNALMSGLRAFASGHRQGAVQGDPWQQGGVFVVMPSGETPYAYRSEAAGDHPPTDAILDAVRAVVRPGA